MNLSILSFLTLKKNKKKNIYFYLFYVGVPDLSCGMQTSFANSYNVGSFCCSM